MNRKGFTLIELLIVVVIIGILAAIAIPKFANTKAKAYIASMKSDLRNLVTAEEAFFADSVKYSNTTLVHGAAHAGHRELLRDGRQRSRWSDRERWWLERDHYEQQPHQPVGDVRDFHQSGGGRAGGDGRRTRLPVNGYTPSAFRGPGAMGH